jgi:hypothetical protein
MNQEAIDARLAAIGGSPEARQAKLREKLEQANDRATDKLRSQIGPAELRRRYEAVKGKAG